MNLIPVTRSNSLLRVSDTLTWKHDGLVPAPERLLLGLRPEKFVLRAGGEGLIPAQVVVVERLGAETVIGCRLLSAEANDGARLLEHDLVFVKISGSPRIRIDDRCALDYRPEDVVWFDQTSGVRIPPAAAAIAQIAS